MGISHAISSDRGETWVEQSRVHSVGGSSHFAISPSGVLAVRITPLSASANKFDPGVDHVAVSTDAGSTWRVRDLPGNRIWSEFDETRDFLRWVEPIAWDSAGRLYAAWSEDNTLWIARSVDEGGSWSSWKVAQDSAPVYFPYLVARGNAELAATWYTGLRHSIRANVAYIEVGRGAAPPRVTRGDSFSFPAFSRTDTAANPVRDTAGEYIPVSFLRDGRIAIVTTIQDERNGQAGFTFRTYQLPGVQKK
ncbi:MAG: glycoside hydrolase [Gemmatimonadota bacterium]|nr:glycoside hydrolase [Gemmatimonadota bacterium]